MILQCIMERSHFIILLLVNFLLILDSSFSDPLCRDSRASFSSKTPLVFCSYNGTSCCSTSDDLSLQERFSAMNISDSGCASLLKSILCARCDPFSAELFGIGTVPRQVPVLCNSTNLSESNFCSKVWNKCENVSISISPFASSLQGLATTEESNVTKLINLWKTETNFCKAFGATSSNGSICFDGKPIDMKPTPPSGMCLEKIGNGSYLNMVPHPDGSNRAFFSNQQGIIWLGTIPKQGSGGGLELNEADSFLDLTDFVHFDTEFGLMGIALHPNFLHNGRLFASFNCDKVKWPRCGGRCSCNSDVNCDPSKIGLDNGAAPCQYQSVIAEFTVNGTTENAKPTEVRRIFTMGLPFTSHHGGQILFGPADGYLYLMMGDGGGVGDPYNFAQNNKSLLGKILRLDIDNIPSAADINKLGLWGNYSIPKDNPFRTDKSFQPEIFASGLRNPWRCSFDSARPSYFMCADVGQDLYEEVNMITKGGNYGWRVFEGRNLFTPVKPVGGNTSVKSINPIFPVMGYNHSEVNTEVGSASITGGYFYRSMTDPCMYGRYLYADLYGDAIWAGIEQPENSSNYITSKIPFTCAHDSPLQCTSVPGSSLPALGYIFSFGEDNVKDIYILASGGVYRIVRASRCNITCSKETAFAPGSSAPSPPSSEATLFLSGPSHFMVFLVLSSLWFFL